MRIWIDIANAPHVTFFRPIVAELQNRDHSVFVTAQDRGQALPLALESWPDATVVGGGYRRSVFTKFLSVAERARTLRRVAAAHKFDVAIGHNSYSQLVAARSLRLPTITIMDYEHQPANHLAFRLATRVIVPSVIPSSSLRGFGVDARRLVRYDGVKEEIALSTFVPQSDFRLKLGISEERPLVTLRTAAEGALYHRHPNVLFDVVLDHVRRSGATVVVSPRTRVQAERFGEIPGICVLQEPVSGPDLLFNSDLFVGAGGTMTREAAVLGTPTVSIFSGRPAAVDRSLEGAGKLSILRTIEEVEELRVQRAEGRHWSPNAAVTSRFVSQLIDVAHDVSLSH